MVARTGWRAGWLAVAVVLGGLGTISATAQAASPAWQTQTIPTVRGTPSFTSVACTSKSFCMALGAGAPRSGASRLSGGRSGLFAERWNGRSWSAPTYLPLRGATYAVLNSVECRSASSCYAVGTVTRNWGAKYGIVVEQWNGESWTVVNVPVPKDDVEGGLSSIACPSARACVAVGGVDIYVDRRVEYRGGIVERWNGSDWTYSYQGPKYEEHGVGFAGVTCPSTQSCVAVGSLYVGPLIQTWNGRSWARASTPSGIRFGELHSVSCSQVGACTAVGVDSAHGELPLVLRESGTSWRAEGTPVLTDGPSTQASLAGVSCTSARSCTAVGTYYPSSSTTERAVAEQWNGSRWTIQATPDPANYTTLTAVSCIRAWCVAVGQTYVTRRSGAKPLIEVRS
jgi:hypothetical protein